MCENNLGAIFAELREIILAIVKKYVFIWSVH